MAVKHHISYTCDHTGRENVPAAEIFSRHTVIVDGTGRIVHAQKVDGKDYSVEAVPEVFGIPADALNTECGHIAPAAIIASIAAPKPARTSAPKPATAGNAAPADGTAPRKRGRPSRASIEAAAANAVPAAVAPLPGTEPAADVEDTEDEKPGTDEPESAPAAVDVAEPATDDTDEDSGDEDETPAPVRTVKKKKRHDGDED